MTLIGSLGAKTREYSCHSERSPERSEGAAKNLVVCLIFQGSLHEKTKLLNT